MPIKIQNTADLAKANAVKCLVYGDSKTGKTRLCATAPRPFIFSAESGLLSLRKYTLPYHVVKTYKDLEEIFKWVTSSYEAKQFDTFCLDSCSEIAEVILIDLKEKHKDPRKAYGEIQDNMLSFFRWFRDLPEKHVYFTAKQERVVDAGTGLMYFGPSMPGQKLGPAVPYLFDEIFQTCVFTDPQTKQEYYALRTKRDQQNQAGDRSGSLDQWEEPDLSKIFAKIQRG